MGFKGVDIEAKLQSQIEDAACVFSLDDIEELEDKPGIFIVKLQSTPNVSYRVDVESGTHECRSFPLIKCCKHLVTIHHHFYEDLDIKPLKLLFVDNITPSSPPPTAEHTAITMHTLNDTQDAKLHLSSYP